MSTRRRTDQGDARVPSVVLVCTACQHTWEPNLLDPTDRSEAASTSCPLCGGWTWTGQITEPGHGRVSPGGRPPSFDSTDYKQRNTVERAISKLKQFRAVATRYDKRAYIFAGTVDVASIRIWLRDSVT